MTGKGRQKAANDRARLSRKVVNQPPWVIKASGPSGGNGGSHVLLQGPRLPVELLLLPAVPLLTQNAPSPATGIQKPRTEGVQADLGDPLSRPRCGRPPGGRPASWVFGAGRWPPILPPRFVSEQHSCVFSQRLVLGHWHSNHLLW